MLLLVRLLIAALGLGLTVMIALTIPHSGALVDEVGALLEPAWGYVTFADLYLGFFLAAVVVVVAERRLWVGLAWAAPIFFLGNIVVAAWLALRLPSLIARLRAR